MSVCRTCNSKNWLNFHYTSECIHPKTASTQEHFTFTVILNKVNEHCGLDAAPFLYLIKEHHPIYKVSRCQRAKTKWL